MVSTASVVATVVKNVSSVIDVPVVLTDDAPKHITVDVGKKLYFSVGFPYTRLFTATQLWKTVPSTCPVIAPF